MRAVAMLAVGIVVGALGAVTAVGAMKKDIPPTKAAMTLMRHHFGAVRKMGEAGGTCDEATLQRHVRGLQGLSGALDTFLPTGADDDAFKRHAAHFTAMADTAASATPGCPALATTTKNLGGACKACHDDFKN